MELTLLWAALTGVAMTWVGTKIWGDRTPPRAFDLLIGAAVSGLAAGRLWAMVTQGVNPVTHPLDILLVRGGVDAGAATVGALAGFLWGVRGRVGDLDAVAPAALLGLAGWHAGCLWRSACLGTISDLPWAWSLPGGVATRHPVELYAALALVMAAWTVSRSSWKLAARSGQGLALAALIRLSTEPLRPSLEGGPLGLYMAGVAAGVAAIAVGAVIDRKDAPHPT
jgi:prolipoprotein diacylglyceryltransferase